MARSLSVRMLQDGVFSKRLKLNSSSRRQRGMVAQGLQFSDAQALDEIPMPNKRGVGNFVTAEK